MNRHVRTADIMGTIVSLHLVGCSKATADRAADACFAELREIDRIFSPYRANSDISRIRRRELLIGDADPLVGEVEAACRRSEQQTGGLFTASWRGGFDPTGFVKGWSVERVAQRHLRPLTDTGEAHAAGIGAGGDVRVFTADGARWNWRVGIVDPHDRSRVLATVTVRNAGIATSGTAERGAHVIDPRTGRPATGAAAATVIAETLEDADVWATAALVAGFDDLSWIAQAPPTTGLVVSAAGGVRRWVDACEVTTSAADQSLPLSA